MNRITTIILIALVSIIVTAFTVRTIERAEGQCEIHPKLTSSQVATIRANVARARTQAFSALTADRKTKDEANKAAEDAAFDTFVHDLRGALGDEYLRHRRALDGCF